MKYSAIIEKDEDGWFVATVPELEDCHTQAKSMDKLLVRVRKAFELCLEVRKSKGPAMHFVGDKNTYPHASAWGFMNGSPMICF